MDSICENLSCVHSLHGFRFKSVQSNILIMDQTSAVKLIRSLKLMAEDPNKRPSLAGDSTCVGGLVMVLSNSNKDVVLEALETLLLLSGCTDQVPFLASFVGMQDQIQEIIDRADSDSTCGQLASILKENLNMKNLPIVETQNDISQGRKLPRNFFLGGQIGKSKTVVLQIKGMTNYADQDECRQSLIGVKGLVSVTFDMASKRAIIRCRTHVQPETLAEAVSSGGTMSAEQVVRGDDGQEVLILFGASCEAEIETSDDLPDYLPDNESPVKLSSKPIAPIGTVPPSDSWWGKAATFINNSFYW